MSILMSQVWFTASRISACLPRIRVAVLLSTLIAASLLSNDFHMRSIDPHCFCDPHPLPQIRMNSAL